MAKTTLILASNSPRRAQLLREHGYCFVVMSPAHAEPEPRSADQIPEHWAEALSYFKARSVAKKLRPHFPAPEPAPEGVTGSTAPLETVPGSAGETLILAADTVVARHNDIIGKPANEREARRILRLLAGTTHQVITGVTLLRLDDGARRIAHDVTTVTMKPMSEEALEDYLESGLWRGKAGAYGIQDESDANIEHVDGSYTNVVGLPMERVERLLNEFGALQDVRSDEGSALAATRERKGQGNERAG